MMQGHQNKINPEIEIIYPRKIVGTKIDVFINNFYYRKDRIKSSSMKFQKVAK